MTDLPDLLTISEAADYLRTTPQALQKQHDRDQAPGSFGFRSGKRLLWQTSDLQRWLGTHSLDTGTTTDPNVAMIRTLSAIEKILTKMSKQLDTVVVYLGEANRWAAERQEPEDE